MHLLSVLEAGEPVCPSDFAPIFLLFIFSSLHVLEIRKKKIRNQGAPFGVCFVDIDRGARILGFHEVRLWREFFHGCWR
jgi:hypothetical protein